MSSKYNVGVGVGVFVFDGNRFLAQRRIGAHGAGTWAPPGGKVDYGEDPTETAIREVKEETDLDIIEIENIGFTNDVFSSDGLHYITLWYVSYKTPNSPLAHIVEPEKCSEQKWMTLEDLQSIPKQELFLTVQHLLDDPNLLKKVRKIATKKAKTALN